MTHNIAPKIIKLVDTTLRDGLQAPGVRFDRDAKLTVARTLIRLGVDELEVGTPAMGAAETADIRRIAALGFDGRLSAWCRARVEDLVAAGRCGVPCVHISLPVSDIHLAAMARDRGWVLDQLDTLLPMARRLFDVVTVGAQDATRTDSAWLGELARRAETLGAHRLRVADTVGIGSPTSVAALIGGIRNAAPALPLEFHGHNDLGMATANALAAAEAGAEALSATVNGLGERSGNAALEQIVMVLHQHPALACRTDSRGLLALCHEVARASGRAIPPGQPVVGEMAFTHESGIHCRAMTRDPATYEPFSPRRIGRRASRFVMGSHSGKAGIRHLLERAGIVASPHQVQALSTLLKGDV